MNIKYDSEYLACTEHLTDNQLNPLQRTKNGKIEKYCDIARIVTIHQVWIVQSYSPVGAHTYPHLMHVSWAQASPPKQPLDPFSRFCTAHQCNQHASSTRGPGLRDSLCRLKYNCCLTLKTTEKACNVNDLEEGHSRGELQELVMVFTRTTPWY